MILNSRNNNFVIGFKKTFLYPSVQERYSPLLKRVPVPYDSVTDYLNASIQSMTMPSISAENVKQTLYEDGVEWKGAYRIGKYMEKNFTLTFKLYESYINYWIMFDQFQQFLSYDNDNQFLPNMTLSFLDQDGFELVVFEFKQITMTSLSELELNFSSNTADYNTFSCDFHYNYSEIKRRLD